MSFLRSREPERPAGASEGRCFVYVLPCAYEDLLKIGHSRNPLQRAQDLQPRYFEFFDLDRAFAVELDKVREARALEHALHARLREHNAPAPLTVRAQAAGLGEWYRGAFAQLQAEAERWRAQGHRVHRPLAAWFARELGGQGDALYARAEELLAQLQGDTALLDTPALAPLRRNLLDTLDAHRAFALRFESSGFDQSDIERSDIERPDLDLSDLGQSHPGQSDPDRSVFDRRLPSALLDWYLRAGRTIP